MLPVTLGITADQIDNKLPEPTAFLNAIPEHGEVPGLRLQCLLDPSFGTAKEDTGIPDLPQKAEEGPKIQEEFIRKVLLVLGALEYRRLLITTRGCSVFLFYLPLFERNASEHRYGSRRSLWKKRLQWIGHTAGARAQAQNRTEAAQRSAAHKSRTRSITWKLKIL